MGKQIYSQQVFGDNICRIEGIEMPAGIYLVKITGSEGSLTVRPLVIQK
jgi:hypothetical protein